MPHKSVAEPDGMVQRFDFRTAAFNALRQARIQQGIMREHFAEQLSTLIHYWPI